MISKFQIDIGKSYKTTVLSSDETAVVSFSGACGYILNDKHSFQMVFIHGNRGEKLKLTQELEGALKRHFI